LLHFLLTNSFTYCNDFVVLEAHWQQAAPAPVPSLPTPAAYIPCLLDLHVQGPTRGSFAPNVDVNLPPPSVLPPGIPPTHLPLPPNNLPPSSLPTGVLQPRNDGPLSAVLSASNLASVMAPVPAISAPPHNVPAKRPPLLPFPDMSLISSVPPPTLGHMNVSDAASLSTSEPLMQFPAPSVTSSFTPGMSNDYVAQSGCYSGYPDQAYQPTENISSFPPLPTSMSSSGIHFGVVTAGEGLLGLSDARFGQLGEAKPAQMTKTARDREARAKKKQRKLAMEPLSVESFLGLSLSKPSTEDHSEKDKETCHTTREVKQETEPTVARGQKEDVVCPEEVGHKVEESVIVIDDPTLPDDVTADCDTAVESKEYHFEWDAMDDDQMSDISVSSVHTSDLSSFDDDVEQAASSAAEADDLVSDASPVKDSQVEIPCNESGELGFY